MAKPPQSPSDLGSWTSVAPDNSDGRNQIFAQGHRLVPDTYKVLYKKYLWTSKVSSAVHVDTQSSCIAVLLHYPMLSGAAQGTFDGKWELQHLTTCIGWNLRLITSPQCLLLSSCVPLRPICSAYLQC